MDPKKKNVQIGTNAGNDVLESEYLLSQSHFSTMNYDRRKAGGFGFSPNLEYLSLTTNGTSNHI
jgi:hypothetical protein